MKQKVTKIIQKFFYWLLVKIPRYFKRGNNLLPSRLRERMSAIGGQVRGRRNQIFSPHPVPSKRDHLLPQAGEGEKWFVIKNSWKWLLKTRRRKMMMAVILAILIITPIYFYLTASKTAAWWDDNWYYRKAINLTNGSGGTLTDFQVSFTLDTTDSTKFNNSCADIRVTDSNANSLPYWIEEAPGCNNSATKIWTKIPSMTTGGYTIYVYYGNSLATSDSDGSKVFSFFDDFNSPSLDSSKWTLSYLGAGGSYNQTGGQVNLSSNGSQDGSTILASTANFTNKFIVEWRRYDTGEYYNDMSFGSGAIVGESGLSNWWHAQPTTGYVHWVQSNTISAYKRVDPSGIILQNNINGPDAGQWVKHKSTYSNSSVWRWSYDIGAGYVLLGTGQTDATYLNDSKYLLFSKGSYHSGVGGTSKLDYVFVRQYASADPSVSLGTEEKSPAPVAYWSFDEGYGTVAHDESSYRNNGTITGATWKPESECVSGKCLYFDGASNTLVTGSGPQLSMNDQAASAEVWVNANTGYTDYKMLMGFNGSGKPWAIYGYQGNKFYVKMWNDAGTGYDFQNGAITINGSEWTHLAFTMQKSGTQMTVNAYKNGSLVGTQTNTVAGTFSSNGQIQFLSSSFGKPVKLDEPKIYNYARTAAQIKKDYNAGLAGMGKAKEGAAAAFGDRSDKWMTDGLVGYWKMDETSGTTAPDSSGNGNAGTLTNMLESGTASSSSTTTQIIPSSTAPFSPADSAYNGMIVSITGGAGCGVTIGTQSIVIGYTGATGTITVSPAFAAEADNCNFQVIHQIGGKFGNGLSFDGKDDYIIANSNPNISSSNTLIAWVKKGSKSSDMNIINTATGSNDRWGIGIANNKFYFERYDGDYKGVMSNATISEGVWYQVAGVWNGSSYKIYVNGVEYSDTRTSTLGLSNGTYIGARDNTQQYWNGLIDETRIYSRALSAGEVAKLYEWAPGPVGHWAMDEKVKGAAQSVYDDSGNNNKGTTYSANGTGMDCTVQGKYGSGCQFDGTDDYITLGTSPKLEITGNLTVSAWIKTSNTTKDEMGIIRPMTASKNRNYEFAVGSGNLSFTSADGNSPHYYTCSQSLCAVADDQWHHVAFMANYPNYAFYVDGKIAQSGTMSAYIINALSPQNFRISGEIGAPGTLWDGSLDDVRIYNYARTQKQILADMNMLQPGQLAPPVAYYDFNEGVGATAYNSGIGGSTFNGNFAAGSSAPTWSNDGKFGKALSFNGASKQYITIGGTIPNATTVSFWIKPSDLYDDYIMSVQTGGYGFVALTSLNLISDSGGCYLDGDTSGIGIPVFPADANWHQVTCVFTDPLSANFITIGKVDMGAIKKYYTGLIDEVKIYNYALTADDVKIDYDNGLSMQMGSSGSVSGTGVPTNAASGKYCVPGDTTSCAAPVGEWKMDEKSGTTVFDTSGNGYNGIAVSAPVWTNGKIGKALNFDESYFVSTSAPQSGNFTVSAWVKTTSCDTKGYIATANWWWMACNAGSGMRLYNGTSWTTSISGVNNGQWHYVAYTGDGTNIYGYVDGRLRSTDVLGNPAASTQLLIGARNGGGGNYFKFNGVIDQFRVYNYARTPSQIAWEYNQGGPVAQYSFNECSGTTAHDESGNGNTGTINIGATAPQTTAGTCTDGSSGSAWYNGYTNRRNDVSKSAMSFDGADDYVDAGTGPSLGVSATANITISAWIRPTTLSGLQLIIAKGKSLTSWGYFMRLNNAAVQAGNSSGGVNLGFSASQSVWQYVTIVYKSDGTATGYLNGIGYPSVSVGTVADTQKLYLGAGQNSDGSALYPFNGQIDDVKIFNYALTAEQVKQQYNGGYGMNFGN